MHINQKKIVPPELASTWLSTDVITDWFPVPLVARLLLSQCFPTLLLRRERRLEGLKHGWG